MRYKVDFGWSFFTSIFIIFFSKVWIILGQFPEAFKYGSIIYQIVDVILFVLSNLSIGVAASIIFYYIQQLIDKKRNFDLYTELRRILLYMLYKHLNLLDKIENFEEIKRQKNKIIGFYDHDYNSIPKFLKLYNDINTLELKERFKKNLANQFFKMNDQELEKFSNVFQKEIQELKNKKDIRYFKDSHELISSLIYSYNDDFCSMTEIYIEERLKDSFVKRDIEEITETVVSDYIEFLESTVELYQELDTFIDSIEKKKILLFIKMLD